MRSAPQTEGPPGLKKKAVKDTAEMAQETVVQVNIKVEPREDSQAFAFKDDQASGLAASQPLADANTQDVEGVNEDDRPEGKNKEVGGGDKNAEKQDETPPPFRRLEPSNPG